MKLYIGQVLLVISLAFAIICGINAYNAVTAVPRGDIFHMVSLSLAFGAGIGALLSASMSYAYWVPKWERVEKRTGRFPGEGRKK